MVRYAREVSKPVVIEKLDFRQKKAAVEGESRKYSRMLSSFSYGKVKAYFICRGYCPVGNGVHVAFALPARKRVKHVWTYWGAISGQLRPALAAQHRLGKRRRRPNPGSGCRAC